MNADTPQLQWTDEAHFIMDGLNFFCSTSDYSRKTTEDEIVMLKNVLMIDDYAKRLGGLQVKRLLEFGIFEGGSIVLFTLLGNLERCVGIDLRKASQPLANILGRHPVGERISLHYETSQGDREAVRRIIAEEFDGQPLDVIVDDGSHLYELTKASLETSFGYLKPGGIYCIEDWGWAHWPNVFQTDKSHFFGKTPLSNLIFELVIAAASAPWIVARVEIRHWQVIVTRGPALAHGAPLDLAAVCLNGGRPLPSA